MSFRLLAESFFESLSFLTERVVIERRRFTFHRVRRNAALQNGVDLCNPVTNFRLAGHIAGTVLSRFQTSQGVRWKIQRVKVSMTLLEESQMKNYLFT